MRDSDSTFDDVSTPNQDSDSVRAFAKTNNSGEAISAPTTKENQEKKVSPFMDRLRPKMGPGTFVVNPKGTASKAGILLNSRITSKGGRVGGELQANPNFQEQAKKMAELAQLGEMIKAEGFEIYKNELGQTVINIPESYQNSISNKATQNIAKEVQEQALEKFNALSNAIAYLAILKARSEKLESTNTKKLISTIEWIIEGSKKEELGDGFNDALGVIESNLIDLEETLNREEASIEDAKEAEKLAEKEATKKLREEIAAHQAALSVERETTAKAIESAEKAKQDLANKLQELQEEQERIKKLLREFSITLSYFLKTEASAELFMARLSDDVAQSALSEAAQELNRLKSSFTEKPTQELLDDFKQKTESYVSLVATLQKKLPVQEPSSEVVEGDDSNSIMSGWPTSVDQKDLPNKAFWADCATNFDEEFARYQNFFSEPERALKIQNYNNLITKKNELRAAILNGDMERLASDNEQNLFIQLRNDITEAENSWELILKEREIIKQKKIEQENLLKKLSIHNAHLEDINKLQESLLDYTGTPEQQDALKNAKELVLNKQQQAKECVESQKPLTEDLVNEYRDGLDIVSGLLTTLKKEKDAFDAAQKAEQERITSLFNETISLRERVTVQKDSFVNDITSPTERKMVEERFKTIDQEKKKLEEMIAGGQLLTEEMVKLYTKHLQDFDRMLSGVENRLRAMHKEATPSKNSFGDGTSDRELLPNGTLIDKSMSKSSSEPASKQLQGGLNERDDINLVNDYAKWAARDFAGFVKWYKKQAWKEGDRNKMAAEKILTIHIQALKDKKRGLETRKEEALTRMNDGHSVEDSYSLSIKIKGLDREIEEIDQEIHYLAGEKYQPKPSPLDIAEEKPSQKRPFTNRLRTGISSEIRPAVSVDNTNTPTNKESKEMLIPTIETSIQNSQSPLVNEPKKEEVVTEKKEVKEIPKTQNEAPVITPEIAKNKITPQEVVKAPENTTKDQTPQNSSALNEVTPEETVREKNERIKRKNDAVTRLALVRAGDPPFKLERIIGPVTLRLVSGGKETLQNIPIPETLASKASWKDFLTEKQISFTGDVTTKKIGFIETIKKYAPSIHIDPKNPATLSVISRIEVYTLINNEEWTYGLDEHKRKELSDIVANLDTIVRATEAQKTMETDFKSPPFSSLIQKETFEVYYDRVLKEAEQANLAEEKIRARQQDFFTRKAA